MLMASTAISPTIVISPFDSRISNAFKLFASRSKIF